MQTLGIDIGGTKTAMALIDGKGFIVAETTFATSSQGPEHQIQLLKKSYQKIISNQKEPQAIGIGIAGQIDKKSGTVLFAPNLDWKYVPLKQMVEASLQLPTAVWNDVRAAAWGECLYGAGRGSQDILFIFIGTGVGGAVISNGKIQEGASNIGGEIGHMVIDIQGRKCTCGQTGCWESVVGGWGITQTAQEAIAKNEKRGSVLLKLAGDKMEGVSAKTVFEAFSQGDPLAQEIVDQVSIGLIAGVTSLVHVLNPARIVVGGGVFIGHPEFLELLQKEVPKRCLSAAAKSFEIVAAKLKENAGIVGAAAFAREIV